MQDIHFIIPLTPRTKKNSQRIIPVGGHYRIIPSQAYLDYEKESKWFMPHINTITWPVNIKAVYYMPTRRKVDLCNLHEALCDILTKYGVLADDNSTIVHSMDGSYVDYDKYNPRTEIWITKL